MTAKTSAALCTLASIATLAAGCGGSSSASGSTTAPTTLALTADASGQLRFDKSTLGASSGAVKIVLANPAATGHDIALEGNGVSEVGPVVQSGGTSTIDANLKPGTYTFYCSVPGHRAAGMQGTLTVR